MSTRVTSWPSLLLSTALCITACANDDDGDDGNSPNDPGSPPPSSWLVGEDGEMLQLTAAEDGTEVSTYPLAHRGDLNAIACLGQATAWVAGDDGAVLRSRDAGLHWQPVALGASDDLQSIAVSEGRPEGQETIWVAGHGGSAWRSDDGGTRWAELDGPAIDWTSVTTDHSGRVGYFAALDGSIWRSDDGSALTVVHPADGLALYDLTVAHDGDVLVAVGEGGRVLVGTAAGLVLASSATDRDLHAVQLASDTETIIAVGDGGTVVRIEAGRPQVQQVLATDDALLGLHLRADGLGQVVGTGGVVLLTEDGGQRWQQVSTGRTADLLDVDDFHAAPHL